MKEIAHKYVDFEVPEPERAGAEAFVKEATREVLAQIGNATKGALREGKHRISVVFRVYAE